MTRCPEGPSAAPGAACKEPQPAALGRKGLSWRVTLRKVTPPSWGSQHPRTGQVCIIKAWAPSLELRTAGMQHPCFGALGGGGGWLTEPPGRPPWLPCVWHRLRSQEHSAKHSCVQSGSPAPQRARPETVTRELRNISQSVRHSQVCCFLLPHPLR